MKRGNTEWRYRFLRINSANSLWHRNLKEISHASPFSILRCKNVSTVSHLFRENRVNARRKLNATLKADRRDRVNPSWIWISKGLPGRMKTWMTAGGPFGPGGVYTGSSGSFQKTGSPVISSVVHVGLVLRSRRLAASLWTWRSSEETSFLGANESRATTVAVVHSGETRSKIRWSSRTRRFYVLRSTENL